MFFCMFGCIPLASLGLTIWWIPHMPIGSLHGKMAAVCIANQNGVVRGGETALQPSLLPLDDDRLEANDSMGAALVMNALDGGTVGTFYNRTTMVANSTAVGLLSVSPLIVPVGDLPFGVSTTSRVSETRLPEWALGVLVGCAVAILCT